MKKIKIILISFLLASCGSSNVINDMQTLEQKALEIPPNFELKPPSDNESILIDDTVIGEEEVDSLDDILETSSNNTENVVNNADNELLDILSAD